MVARSALTDQFCPVTDTDNVRVEKDIQPDQDGGDQRCHTVAESLYRQNQAQYRTHTVEETRTYQDVGKHDRPLEPIPSQLWPFLLL